jgi:hypothetical protein
MTYTPEQVAEQLIDINSRCGCDSTLDRCHYCTTGLMLRAYADLLGELAAKDAEIARLTAKAAAWEAEALRYCQNSEYHQSTRELLGGE